MIFSRQQLKSFKVPDTFTHMFGFFTLQLHVKTIWYFQFSSDRNSPCWTTNWKWSMKAFCHHINCYFTVEEEGWPPVGKKSRTVFPNKWRYGKGTVGFRSCSPWDTLLAVESVGPWMGWNIEILAQNSDFLGNKVRFWRIFGKPLSAKGGRVPPFSAEKFLLSFWKAEVR